LAAATFNEGPQRIPAKYRSFLADEVKAMIGVEIEWTASSEPVSLSEVCRLVHAIMDDNPVYRGVR
jgi:hypothetical protein